MSVVRHAVFTSNQGLLESRHVSSCVGFLFRCYSDPNYIHNHWDGLQTFWSCHGLVPVSFEQCLL